MRTTALPGGVELPVLGQGTWRIRCSIEEGLLTNARHRVLGEVAKRHGATASQVALAWVIREDGVIAIPKSANAAHVRENRGAADVTLTRRDLSELDLAFPAPSEPVPLETR